jgi:hypothetical protein
MQMVQDAWRRSGSGNHDSAMVNLHSRNREIKDGKSLAVPASTLSFPHPTPRELSGPLYRYSGDDSERQLPDNPDKLRPCVLTGPDPSSKERTIRFPSPDMFPLLTILTVACTLQALSLSPAPERVDFSCYIIDIDDIFMSCPSFSHQAGSGGT